MAQHTPGPWRTTEHQVLVMSGERTVADVRVNDAPYEEQAANARLIAAAPELLAACEVAAEHMQMNDRLYSAQERELYDELRAAIAKARGNE